ncbi:MAG: hypothetical protein ABI333_06585 [bacterium]
MRIRTVAILGGALLSLAGTPARAGQPKDCSMLPVAQRAECKQRVARECGHHRKYWPKVHCEDKIVKGMDTCRNPSIVQTCSSLYLDSEVCDKADAMQGHSGVDPAWLDAARRFPGVLRRVRTFKPTWKACGGQIPGCRLSAHAIRKCSSAVGTFRAKWAQYYSTFKSRHLKASWNHIKTSLGAAGVLATLRQVASLNKISLIRVNDTAVDRAIASLTARRRTLRQEERRKEARAWRRVRGSRFKKIHKHGKWANCVFSSQSLGNREKRTDQVVTSFARPAQIYVRCYLRSRPRRMKRNYFRATLFTGFGNKHIALNIKGYPKTYTFELSADPVFGHALRTLRAGEHEIALHVHGSTGVVTGRERVRNYDAHGKVYYTTNTRSGGLIFSKGSFTYVVSSSR